MKVTEELDSLRVMALEPIEFVLAPKYLAALISVPCLSIIANLFGILAGGLFMFFSTRLSLLLYAHYVFSFHYLARRDHGTYQECGVRNHHRSRRMPGRIPCPRRARFCRSLHYQCGGEIDIPRHCCRRGVYCDFLFHGEKLMPIISVRDLVVEYDGRRVLNGLNLDIEHGETMVLARWKRLRKKHLVTPDHRAGTP